MNLVLWLISPYRKGCSRTFEPCSRTSWGHNTGNHHSRHRWGSLGSVWSGIKVKTAFEIKHDYPGNAWFRATTCLVLDQGKSLIKGELTGVKLRMHMQTGLLWPARPTLRFSIVFACTSAHKFLSIANDVTLPSRHLWMIAFPEYQCLRHNIKRSTNDGVPMMSSRCSTVRMHNSLDQDWPTCDTRYSL